MLVHPADWPVLTADPRGPVAVHRQLVAWLDGLGLRAADRDADAALWGRVRGV